MRQGECNPPFSLPHDRLTWDSRKTDKENDENDKWTADDKDNWNPDSNAKKSNSKWRADDENWNGEWNAKKARTAEKDNWNPDSKANEWNSKWRTDEKKDNWNGKWRTAEKKDNWNPDWKANKAHTADDNWKGNGRRHERFRPGTKGGRARFGDRGGQNKFYYEGLHIAKRKGPQYARAFMAKHGPPPGQNGPKFHDRKY